MDDKAPEIGDAALDFPCGPKRDAYVDHECSGDPELKARVLRYIAGADEPLTAVDESIVPCNNAPSSLIGRRVGPWTLVRPLGEGGFGLVYLAERNDNHVRQRSAVKFLQGTVRLSDIEMRFRDERQVLANLAHPYIVSLLDAGTTDEGQLYFVMEYVEDGKPIDIYIRDHALSIRERIRLFQKVCEAVSYAHRRLVVHRDLKPTNILIDPDGNPRLLDFGMAKLLDPTHQSVPRGSHSGQIILGTGAYMSPEQAQASTDVGPASDVYSLGIMLYEMITGTDPYNLQSRGRDFIQHIICTVDPERPSKAFMRVSAEIASRHGSTSSMLTKEARCIMPRAPRRLGIHSSDVAPQRAAAPIPVSGSISNRFATIS